MARGPTVRHCIKQSKCKKKKLPFQFSWKSQEPGNLDARFLGVLDEVPSQVLKGVFYQFVTKQLDCMGAELLA